MVSVHKGQTDRLDRQTDRQTDRQMMALNNQPAVTVSYTRAKDMKYNNAFFSFFFST